MAGHLVSSVQAVSEVAPGSWAEVQENLDPLWIEEALQASGVATIRRRRLPAEQVLWLVLGMAVYRERSIVEVAAKLDLALPGSRGVTASPAAVSQARKRLGAAPLSWLFERTGRAWAEPSAVDHAWRGLGVYGIDGSVLRVADSPENREYYGGPKDRTGSECGYPLLRLVALMALRSHLLHSVICSPYRTAESAQARALLREKLPGDSLLLADRGLAAVVLLLSLEAEKGQYWLVRVKSNARWTNVSRLGPHDYLVEVKVTAAARKKDPWLPETFQARAIQYQRPGFQPEVLLTSLLDPELFPAAEIISMYHERWELELGFDEIKTDMLLQEESLRSKSPAMTSQEVHGLLLVYNLVRLEMERAASEAGVEPVRISFVTSLWLIRDEWLWSALSAPGAIPKHLRALRAELKNRILPERRARSSPRAVKVKMSNYPRKRPPAQTSGAK